MLGSRACTGLGSVHIDWKNAHDHLFRRPKHVLYHIDHSSQRGVLNGTWRKDVARCHRCAASPVVGACVRPSGVSGFIRGVSGNPYPCEVRPLDHQSDHNGEHRPPNRVGGLCNRKAAVSLRKERSRVVIGCFGEKTQKTGAGSCLSHSQSRAHIKKGDKVGACPNRGESIERNFLGYPPVTPQVAAITPCIAHHVDNVSYVHIFVVRGQRQESCYGRSMYVRHICYCTQIHSEKTMRLVIYKGP